MKVLVVGGTRFFGKRLVQNLIQKGHEVTVLTRGQTPVEFAGTSWKKLSADRRNEASLKEALSGLDFDVVVDQICMTGAEAEMLLRVVGDRAKHWVMTSTLSVHPMGGNQKESDFSALQYTPKMPTNPAEEYAEGKRAAEKVYLTQCKTSLSIMRIPVVVGEDDYTQRLEMQVKRVARGEPLYFPNLEARFGFVHSADAARALEWMITERKDRIYNIASSEALRLRELVQLMEQASNKKAVISKEPIEGGNSPFGVPQDWYLNVDKAKAEGFEAMPLMDWLPDLVKSFVP